MTTPAHRGAAVEALAKRDRAVVLAALAAVAALAWVHLGLTARAMGRHAAMGMAMPRMEEWSAVDVLLLFVMWAVMMVAMMLPTAAPVVLTFASIQRRRRERDGPYVSTAVFALGYLLVWTAYGAGAALAQWALHEAALLSPTMASTSAVLGGGLLIGAGLFQFTPLKRVCLTQCRSPITALSSGWKEGTRGALRMGVRHGGYCVGCCWVLMALLFVAGVMNLLWVATIAAFVLIEKVAPGGGWVGRVAGALLVGWGVWMIAGTVA